MDVVKVSNKENIKHINLLAKHNNLIQGKYHLSTCEQKLLYKIFEEIQSKNYTTREVALDFETFYSEFKGIYKMNITKKDFRDIIFSIQDKKPYIIIGDEYIRTQWYKVVGKIDLSEVRLIIDEDVFKYIQSLTRDFTGVRLSVIYAFKSPHSIRIYELLKQWSMNKSIIEFDLNFLKELLGIEKSKGYQSFTNFDKNVLKKAVDEINEKSELKVTYEKIKKGRAVVGVKFLVSDSFRLAKKNKNDNNEEDKGEQPAKVEGLPEEIRLSESVVEQFKNDFKDYDFMIEEYKNLIIAAQKVVFKKKEVNIITDTEQTYFYFKAVLSNKIKEYKKMQEEAEKQQELEEFKKTLGLEELEEMAELGFKDNIQAYFEFKKELEKSPEM